MLLFLFIAEAILLRFIPTTHQKKKSTQVRFLINGGGEGSVKFKQAQKMGVQVISEDQFLEMLATNKAETM
jgi:BRCT domain type II-containing protein